VARLLHAVFGHISIPSSALVVILAFIIIVIPHVVIGEIVPKSYTLPRAERVALAVGPPIRAFFVGFGWFISFLDWLSQRLMHALGVKTTNELEGAHSEVELRMLLRQGERSGVLEADEQAMIDKVFDFSDTSVEHVMVPRPDIVALPVSLTPTAAMEQVLQHPYTRYPVYEEEFDNVLGVLHVRRLFVALQNGAGASPDLRSLLYPAHLVPETKRLVHLLTEIRRQKGHMAIVVDEYGSVAGLVTLEDLLEEIVGEIDDEFDPEDAPIVRLGPDRYRVEGSLPVEEFNERFERKLSDDDYHTIGGIIFGELGRAPVVGDSVEIGHVKFDVAAVEGSRILHADASLLPRPERSSDDEDGDA
jgi:CBS domain containing-hemolysin-like protein